MNNPVYISTLDRMSVSYRCCYSSDYFSKYMLSCIRGFPFPLPVVKQMFDEIMNYVNALPHLELYEMWQIRYVLNKSMQSNKYCNYKNENPDVEEAKVRLPRAAGRFSFKCSCSIFSSFAVELVLLVISAKERNPSARNLSVPNKHLSRTVNITSPSFTSFCCDDISLERGQTFITQLV